VEFAVTSVAGNGQEIDMKRLAVAAALLAAATSTTMAPAQADEFRVTRVKRAAVAVVVGGPYYPGVGPAYPWAPNTYHATPRNIAYYAPRWSFAPTYVSEPLYVARDYPVSILIRRGPFAYPPAYGPPGSAYAYAYP
jgi:hypothetical protein